ncbi:MAG: hypothetical protein WCT39_02950 [Candidatus Margulisiibacteriota bacterium]
MERITGVRPQVSSLKERFYRISTPNIESLCAKAITGKIKQGDLNHLIIYLENKSTAFYQKFTNIAEFIFLPVIDGEYSEAMKETARFGLELLAKEERQGWKAQDIIRKLDQSPAVSPKPRPEPISPPPTVTPSPLAGKADPTLTARPVTPAPLPKPAPAEVSAEEGKATEFCGKLTVLLDFGKIKTFEGYTSLRQAAEKHLAKVSPESDITKQLHELIARLDEVRNRFSRDAMALLNKLSSGRYQNIIWGDHPIEDTTAREILNEIDPLLIGIHPKGEVTKGLRNIKERIEAKLKEQVAEFIRSHSPQVTKAAPVSTEPMSNTEGQDIGPVRFDGESENHLLNLLEKCISILSDIIANGTTQLNANDRQTVISLLDETKNMRVKCNEQSQEHSLDAKRLICNLQAKGYRLLQKQEDLPKEIVDQLMEIERATGKLLSDRFELHYFIPDSGERFNGYQHQIDGEVPMKQGEFVIATTVEPGYSWIKLDKVFIKAWVTVNVR